MASVKICVFSDSHGCSENMLWAIKEESPDYIFFLGDGASDMEAVRKVYPHITACIVRGNCDTHSAAPVVLRKTIDGKKFFAAHGHTFNVKTDPTFWDLRSSALEADADVVLFGHTHGPFKDRSLGMEVLNPGTIGNTSAPSYGIVRIADGSISTELKMLKGGGHDGSRQQGPIS